MAGRPRGAAQFAVVAAFAAVGLAAEAALPGSDPTDERRPRAAAVAGLDGSPGQPGGAGSLAAGPPSPPDGPAAAWVAAAGLERLAAPPRGRRATSRVPRRGSGRLRVVPGSSPVRGSGPPRRFLVEIERGIGVGTAAGRRTGAFVEQVLLDRRGWTGGGGTALERVSREPAEIRVTLASPDTTDRLCAPLLTAGRYSCWQNGRAVLNLVRWRRGVRGYRDLADYRRYMVNHEVGHGLGHGHAFCPGQGRRAPVMLQQSKGLDGCRPGPWPLRVERG